MPPKPKNRVDSGRSCFVISPIGADNSPERRKANYVLRNLIRPALLKQGYKSPRRIDHLAPIGRIDDNIVSQLAKADLVVVDLAGLNPNVMYELGVRQAWCLPILPLAPEGTKLPFDIVVINTVFYPALGDYPTLTNKQIKLTVNRVRKQVDQISPKCSTPLTGPRVFQEVMKEFGERYSLNAVYRAKSRTLQDLKDALQQLRTELVRALGRPGPKKPQPFKEFVPLVERPFASLRDRVDVLRYTADHSEAIAPLADACLAICKDMDELQRRGSGLVQLLKMKSKPGNWKQRYNRSIKTIDGMKDALDPLVERIRCCFG